MKWIDYIALTLTIIGAIVWGLIGLSQFKETPATLPKKEVSIKNKDIKLSDLMRRVS